MTPEGDDHHFFRFGQDDTQPDAELRARPRSRPGNDRGVTCRQACCVIHHAWIMDARESGRAEGGALQGKTRPMAGKLSTDSVSKRIV